MKYSKTLPDVSFDSRHDPLPPGATHLWSHMVMLEAAWRLVWAIRDWPGVVIAPDDGGLCIALDGVTIGYLRWNARIDLLFAPDVGDRVVAERLARRDPEQPHTGRVVTDVRTAADVDRTVWLLRLAFLTADFKAIGIHAAPSPTARRWPQ